LRNLAVRFEYEEIDLYDISAPPMKIQVKKNLMFQQKQQDLDELRQSIIRFYQSVSDRINNVPTTEIHFSKVGKNY
jgi:hypothetical protein